MATVTLKGTPVTLNGDLPSVGSRAPNFRLTGPDLKDCTLDSFRGKRKLISIVPSLDTPVCALSTKKFSESASKHPEAAVLVVSCDLPFAQQRFCGAEQASGVVTLSMMRSRDFARDYGVLIKDGPLEGIAARAVVVLDERDRVLYTELVPEIAQEPNYEKALSALLTRG
jgi:thiol peroxidase